ncbi:MAG: MFS transporter [Rhabdochlamydiaceae bacterium]|nr:MFS transporter [Candidatus Amphrikana amoebophyrae]
MRKLLPLYVVIFIAFLGISMSILIFTEFTMNLKTSSLPKSYTFAQRSLLFGILTSVYPLGQFLGSPVLGALSDRYGRRPILIWTLLFTIVAYVFVSLSLHSVAVIWICITLFLAGIGEANMVIAQGAIADTSEKRKRAHLFGYITVVASSAYIVGPIFGGQLSNPTIVKWFNYSTPYWIVTGLLVLIFLWIFFGFKETHKKENRKHIKWVSALTNLTTIFTDKAVRKFYMVNFLAYIAIFGYFRLFPLYVADQYDTTQSLLSYVIAWVSVPLIIVNSFFIKPLLKHFRHKYLFEFSLWMIGIGSIFTIFFQPFGFIWISTCFTTIFIAIALTVSITVISNKVSHAKQGRVLGNNLSLQVIPQIVIGIIGGSLAIASIKLPLLMCSAFAIAAAVFSIKLDYSPVDN